MWHGVETETLVCVHVLECKLLCLQAHTVVQVGGELGGGEATWNGYTWGRCKCMKCKAN